MIGAVDIGGTKIAVGMVDGDGQVQARLECPTEAQRGLEDGLSRVIRMLHEAASEVGEVPQGIGIGCTGPVDPRQGTIGQVEFLPGWEGANLVEELSGAFGTSVAIENDADAAALGEWAWGAGAGTRTFLLVTVGTGIGVGAILDGRLYRGVNGSHPEMGHHVIEASGPVCWCGNRGCWESLASGPAMESWAECNHPKGRHLSAQALCLNAEKGDQLAQAAVRRTAHYLGIGLANLVTLLTPEVIVLGGGLLQSRHLFWPAIQETIQTTCSLVPHHDVRLEPSRLGALTGLVGAARVWVHRYASQTPESDTYGPLVSR